MAGPLTIRRGLAIGASAMIAAGCGGSDDSSDKSAPAAEGKAPPQLVGAYTTTLKPGDVPADAPGELTSGSKQWKLTIANSGGVDDGPVFAIANGELGALENPSFGIKDDVILLHREERDGENGATWEVEVTKPDGNTVDVRLDASFNKVVVEGDHESGPDRADR